MCRMSSPPATPPRASSQRVDASLVAKKKERERPSAGGVSFPDISSPEKEFKTLPGSSVRTSASRGKVRTALWATVTAVSVPTSVGGIGGMPLFGASTVPLGGRYLGEKGKELIRNVATPGMMRFPHAQSGGDIRIVEGGRHAHKVHPPQESPFSSR